ncbi:MULTISPECIES: hypothetical protein [unclassified Nonomuraea]
MTADEIRATLAKLDKAMKNPGGPTVRTSGCTCEKCAGKPDKR